MRVFKKKRKPFTPNTVYRNYASTWVKSLALTMSFLDGYNLMFFVSNVFLSWFTIGIIQIIWRFYMFLSYLWLNNMTTIWTLFTRVKGLMQLLVNFVMFNCFPLKVKNIYVYFFLFFFTFANILPWVYVCTSVQHGKCVLKCVVLRFYRTP